MSPRVAGAALALLAAILLVGSLAGIPTGWWDGHPLRNGEAMHKKDVHVSMLSAEGCNTGGDGRCEPLEMTGGFDAVRYAELGVSGILVLACLLLAGTTLAASERRKGFGKLVIAVAVLCLGIAGALIFMPKMKIANVSLPIGPGLFVFFGGIACAILGSVVAMRPTPKLELQPPRQSFAPALGAPPAAQPVDVLAMLQPEPRPAAPDPMVGRPPPSPGGQLAGPAGPLAPPLFGSAAPPPYTVPGIPTPAPFAAPEPPPLVPPTPFPLPPSPFTARPGGPPLATPPPPEARARNASAAPPLPGPDRSRSSAPVPAVPGDPSRSSAPVPAVPGDPSRSSAPVPAVPGDPSRSSSSVPAIPGDPSRSSSSVPAIPGERFKASGTGPALPGMDRSKGSGNAPALPEARPTSPSGAPPSAAARMKAASVAPIDRPKSPSVAPIDRPKSPSVAPIPSTVAGLVPPPPARAKPATGLPPPRAKGPSMPPLAGPKLTTVAAVVPPPAAVAPILAAKLPIRADTDPSDHLETMDRDAMTIAREGAPAVSVGRPTTDAAIGDSTDAAVALPAPPRGDEHTDLAAQPIEPRDSATDIQTSAQRKLTQSELVRTVARESQSEIETIAREKISASELAIGDSTSPVIIPPDATRSEVEELGEAPTDRAPSTPAKIPVSTASDSLPPPKKEEVATSGPTPACPQCEAPMAWVEEHLRFYCKSCRMYF